RSLRRMLRRRKHRKERFIQLIIENKHIFSFDKREQVVAILEKETKLPWDVKVRGIGSQLPKKKLIYILYHYLSHRGFTYLEDNDHENGTNDEQIELGYTPDLIKKDVELAKKFNNLSFPSQKQCFVFNVLKYQDHKLNRSFSINN
ncbi:hypothetical protein II654_01295, partial [bacterium]|nr:hypothetical protein [bacterium]